MAKYFHSLTFILFLFIIVSCSTESTPVYQLNTSTDPIEAGSVTPSDGEYEEGEQVELTATANEHWVFDRWQGDHTGNSNPTSITIDADTEITALFTKKEYPLTIDIEGEGTVSERVVQAKSTDYPHDTTIELTANPVDDWVFLSWSGELEGNENPQSITIEGEVSVTASFESIDNLLTIDTDGDGVVDVVQISSRDNPSRSEVQLFAKPSQEWEFAEWQGDLSGNENPTTIKLHSQLSINAYFITLPSVSTVEVDNIKFDSASIEGKINDDGGSEIIDKGVCWNIEKAPTTENTCISKGEGEEDFTITIQNLEPKTIYFARTYAENAVGTAYGNEIEFKTNKRIVTDIDGNEYEVVDIGGQVWMAENLRTTKYTDGAVVSNIKNSRNWENTTSGAWSFYNNNAAYNDDFGKLYNWHAVNDSRGLCPKGWSVPSRYDWDRLINYLGGNSLNSNTGGKLKATGTEFWNSPNRGATNESGFNARGGGARISGSDPDFRHFGSSGSFWSSRAHETITAWGYILFNDASRIVTTPEYYKTDGLSVRCLKN